MILLRLVLIIFSIIGLVLSLDLAYFGNNSRLTLFEKTSGMLNTLPFFALGLWAANEIKPLAVINNSIFAKVLISISAFCFASYCIEIAKYKETFLTSLSGFLGQFSFKIVVTLTLLFVGLNLVKGQKND